MSLLVFSSALGRPPDTALRMVAAAGLRPSRPLKSPPTTPAYTAADDSIMATHGLRAIQPATCRAFLSAASAKPTKLRSASTHRAGLSFHQGCALEPQRGPVVARCAVPACA